MFLIVLLCTISAVQPRNSSPAVIISLNETNELLRPLSPVTIVDWFKIVNQQYQLLAHLTAVIAWELSVQPNDFMTQTGIRLTSIRSQWRNLRCDEATNLLEILSDTLGKQEARMLYLLCRGPKFTNYQTSELNKIMGKAFTISTETEVCLPLELDICLDSKAVWDNTYIRTPSGTIYPMPLDGEEFSSQEPLVIGHPLTFRCFKNEPDLEKLMTGDFSPLGPLDCLLPRNLIFRWAWQSIRLAVGPSVGSLFNDAVAFMNVGAQNEGYKDMGEVWREELEMTDLERKMNRLLYDVKPFYMLLHSVTRHVLYEKHKTTPAFSRDGLVPADLFGHMWAQNWAALQPTLILPFTNFDFDRAIRARKWTAKDMVRRAEDFYVSLGLEPMTEKFWENSFFEQSSNLSNCHGSAADMYDGDDFRMIVCAEQSMDGFYTIVHEMGHVEYYMSSSTQPPLFNEAANSAISETIGDVIYLAMMVPQHLSRLGLVDDKELISHSTKPFDNEYLCGVFCGSDGKMAVKPEGPEDYSNMEFLGHRLPNFTRLNEKFKERMSGSVVPSNRFDVSLLLHLALSKIPSLPFGFVMDRVRWDMFSGELKIEEANDFFWKLIGQEMGIKPPGRKSRSGLFDMGAKFHFADNTPFSRYFLAGFLQAQIFRGLCEMSLFGKVIGRPLPMPLHRCDIYGSKKAGKLLKNALSLGASAHWTEVLYILTGQKEITADALLEYYQPLIGWLEHVVLKFNLPCGWLDP